jgi:hypothetical protein
LLLNNIKGAQMSTGMIPMVVGFDPGNSEATLTFPGPKALRKSLTIPSYVGSGALAELGRIRGGAGKATLERHEYVLEHGDRSSFVGELALEQSADATAARGDINRYWNGHTLKLLLVLAGTAFRETELTLRVVTGLPVQVWRPETRKHVQSSLLGRHEFKLNGQRRVITVDAMMTMMEGAGALAELGLPDAVPQAVIDVGGRTADLFWINGQKPVLPRCKGEAIGVEKIADELQARFERQHGRPLSPSETRSILRAYAGGQPLPTVFVDGKPVTVNGEVPTAIEGVADELKTFIAQTWRSGEQGKVAAEAAKVLLVGGGAYYFADAVRGIIRHVEVPREPEIQNARGYQSVGLRLTEEDWARLR